MQEAQEAERREKQEAEECWAREELEAREQAERERVEREAQVLKAEQEKAAWEEAERERRAQAEGERMAAAAQTFGVATGQTLVSSSEGALRPGLVDLWPCDGCHQARTHCEPPTGRGTSCQHCKAQKMVCLTKGAWHSKIRPRKRGRDEVESEPEGTGADGEESKGKGKGKGRAGRSVSTRLVGVTPRLGRRAVVKPRQEPEDWDHPFWRLADKLHQAEDRLMSDLGAAYLVGSGLLGAPAMFATHDTELQELRDDINSVRQEMAMLREDIGELYRKQRGSKSAGSGRSAQTEEGVGNGSEGVPETQLVRPEDLSSDVVMLS